MKKHIMLGVKADTNRCCILYCLLPFNMLVPDEIETGDFGYEATNWCGNDDIQRTLSILNRELTGNSIKLPNPITVYGADNDSGLEHRWQFSFNEIHETRTIDTGM